ncbi:hypothetical protein AYO44_04390 [Planctomycetaceae bacterium SCGC AG-212-F19]|nr:hypothetical protein AYO44_04390 [Planctomycetaceae bacterium SCGC AG-212-F19]
MIGSPEMQTSKFKHEWTHNDRLSRWKADGADLWMIVLKSSGNHNWPWSQSGDDAEKVFQQTYPSLHAHMKPLANPLRKRQDQGEQWWELRACAYWEDFEKPKIIYQEIQFHPCYALDRTGQYSNNKTFFVARCELYLLAVLNSPLCWWHNWRSLPHLKDEALTPVAFRMESLPIAEPTDKSRKAAEKPVPRLIKICQTQQSTRRQILDWLRVEHEIAKPRLKLQSPLDLEADAFLAAVKKARGMNKPLTAAAAKNLIDEHRATIEPARGLAAEALALERKVSDLVNEAYGLTPDEINLMWDTAPPRMPLARPDEPHERQTKRAFPLAVVFVSAVRPVRELDDPAVDDLDRAHVLAGRDRRHLAGEAG